MWVNAVLALSILVLASNMDESANPQEGYLPSTVGILDEASINAALTIHPDDEDLCLRVFLFENMTAVERLELTKAGLDFGNLSAEEVMSHRSTLIQRFLSSKLKIRDTDVITDQQMMEARDGRFPAVILYCPKYRVREVVQSLAKAKPEIELVDAYAAPVTMQKPGKRDLGKATAHFFPSYWRVRSDQDPTTFAEKLDEAGWQIVDRADDGAITALIGSEDAHKLLNADANQTVELVQSNLGVEAFPGARKYRIWIAGKPINDAIRELPPDVQLVSDGSDELRLTIWANLRQKVWMEQHGIILFPAENPMSSPTDLPRKLLGPKQGSKQ